MHKIIFVILLAVLLTACGKEEEELPVEEPVAEISYGTVATDFEWQDRIMPSLFGRSSYEISGDDIVIYPYSDSPNCLTVHPVLINDIDFWSAVESSYGDSAEIATVDDLRLLRVNDVTYGYLPISEDVALIAYTDTLPSFYLSYFMLHL